MSEIEKVSGSDALTVFAGEDATGMARLTGRGEVCSVQWLHGTHPEQVRGFSEMSHLRHGVFLRACDGYVGLGNDVKARL